MGGHSGLTNLFFLDRNFNVYEYESGLLSQPTPLEEKWPNLANSDEFRNGTYVAAFLASTETGTNPYLVLLNNDEDQPGIVYNIKSGSISPGWKIAQLQANIVSSDEDNTFYKMNFGAGGIMFTRFHFEEGYMKPGTEPEQTGGSKYLCQPEPSLLDGEGTTEEAPNAEQSTEPETEPAPVMNETEVSSEVSPSKENSQYFMSDDPCGFPFSPKVLFGFAKEGDFHFFTSNGVYILPLSIYESEGENPEKVPLTRLNYWDFFHCKSPSEKTVFPDSDSSSSTASIAPGLSTGEIVGIIIGILLLILILVLLYYLCVRERRDEEKSHSSSMAAKLNNAANKALQSNRNLQTKSNRNIGHQKSSLHHSPSRGGQKSSTHQSIIHNSSSAGPKSSIVAGTSSSDPSKTSGFR